MYRDHPDFPKVPRETLIWQYMPLCKFISLLKEQKLYFNRIDNFKDKCECTLTALDKKTLYYTENANAYWERERKLHFVSCWLESDYELALMWDTYGKGGVAIKTSVGNLIDSLTADAEHHQYLARVKYVDELSGGSQDINTPLNILKIPLSKRKYYEQEKEIRLLYTRSEVDDTLGISFPIDLNRLITEVRVHPGAPHYFLDIVNSELEAAKIDVKALFSEI